MAANLATKGKLDEPLFIHNRTISKASELATELKSKHTSNNKPVVSVINSPLFLVQKSDIIYIILGNDEHVLTLCKDITQSIGSEISGKTFVDCSTIAPKTTAEVAQLFESHGASFVAAPVFGAPAMAEAGQLVWVFASHSRPAIDKLLPYTKDVMGRDYIILEGKPPGTASLMKLSGNHFIASMVLTLAESMTLADKSGLGTENVVKFLEKMFGGPYVPYAKRMESGDYDRGNGDLDGGEGQKPLFGVDLALKDARHMLSIADENGVELGIVKRAVEILQIVKEQRGERGDLPGMYGAMRVKSGLSYNKLKTD